jgi:hypothetical protein
MIAIFDHDDGHGEKSRRARALQWRMPTAFRDPLTHDGRRHGDITLTWWR